MKRFLVVLLILSVMSPLGGCGGGKSGSEVPTGAKMFITPSDDIKIESSSSVVEQASQLFLVAARDAVPGTTTGPTGGTGGTGTTTAAAVVPTGRGIRDVGFSVAFEFSDPPGREVLADTASAVTLCDGTRIVNTPVQKVTDGSGNYNLCVSYKTGGGISYTGRLIVSSGDQSPFVNFIVTSKPQDLAVKPDGQQIPAGSLAQFTIVGGVPPYAVAASPSVLAPVPAVVTSMGGSFTVAVPLGTPDNTKVDYTITDAAGTQVSASLTVTKPSSVPEILPGSVDVLPGGSARFTLVNGYPPYFITSSNALVSPSPSTVSFSGGYFDVKVPLTVQSGTIKFTVRDNAGSSATATVNVVQPPAIKLSPSFVNVPAGNNTMFVVTGGLPPYKVTTSDATIVAGPSTVQNSGGTFRLTVPSGTPAESVTVTVTDVLGNVATATMNVIGVAPTLMFSPTSASVSGAAGGMPSFVITGGQAPYTVITSNAAQAYFGTPGTASVTSIPNGGAVTVTVPAGTAPGTVTLTASDSANNTASVTITITP